MATSNNDRKWPTIEQAKKDLAYAEDPANGFYEEFRINRETGKRECLVEVYKRRLAGAIAEG